METRVAQENGGRVCRDWESGWIYRQPTWTSSSLLGLWKSREPLPLLEAGAQQVGGWGTEDSMGVLRQWENRKDWGGQPAWSSPSLQGPQESRESLPSFVATRRVGAEVTVAKGLENRGVWWAHSLPGLLPVSGLFCFVFLMLIYH